VASVLCATLNISSSLAQYFAVNKDFNKLVLEAYLKLQQFPRTWDVLQALRMFLHHVALTGEAQVSKNSFAPL
jgi:Sec7-like guanine-nucleotide exchange factor